MDIILQLLGGGLIVIGGFVWVFFSGLGNSMPNVIVGFGVANLGITAILYTIGEHINLNLHIGLYGFIALIISACLLILLFKK